MKQYRLLNDGEIIQAGDEYYHCLMGKWTEIKKYSSIGNKFNSEEWQPFRRLVKPVQPDIPADGDPVIVGGNGARFYSAGKTGINGYLHCYTDGMDKWTSKGATELWSQWRRPTQEELA